MKNLVVDINDQYAVVLTDAGDFKKILNTGNLKVGDEFTEKVKRFTPRLARAMTSIAALFLVGFIASFYYLNFTPHGYIDVRINPGIKITLNAMNRVIAIDGLNQDGVDLLAAIAQKESDPEKVVQSIVSKAVEMGFFKAGNPVRITVAIKDPEKVAVMENTLMQTAQTVLETNSIDVPVSAFSIDVQDYKALESDRKDESGDTTDYSSEWKEKTVTPSICDVKFRDGKIIIEFNHNLTLDNAKVYAYPNGNPGQKLEASILESKNDKLTVSFAQLTPGETYKLEVSGITGKDGKALASITAQVVQPVNHKRDKGGSQNATASTDTTGSAMTSDPTAAPNGNGSVNGSANGNYRNEDGKGNGNGYGLDKQNGKTGEDQNKGNGNKAGNPDQSINKSDDENDDEDVDSDEGEDEGSRDEDSSDEAVSKAAISSVELTEGKYKITFNMGLKLSEAVVTAAPVNDQSKTVTGQVSVLDNRTILVNFPLLEPNITYSISISNTALDNGTKIDTMKRNYHVDRIDRDNKGNSAVNNDEDSQDNQNEDSNRSNKKD